MKPTGPSKIISFNDLTPNEKEIFQFKELQQKALRQAFETGNRVGLNHSKKGNYSPPQGLKYLNSEFDSRMLTTAYNCGYRFAFEKDKTRGAYLRVIKNLENLNEQKSLELTSEQQNLYTHLQSKQNEYAHAESAGHRLAQLHLKKGKGTCANYDKLVLKYEKHGKYNDSKELAQAYIRAYNQTYNHKKSICRGKYEKSENISTSRIKSNDRPIFSDAEITGAFEIENRMLDAAYTLTSLSQGSEAGSEYQFNELKLTDIAFAPESFIDDPLVYPCPLNISKYSQDVQIDHPIEVNTVGSKPQMLMQWRLICTRNSLQKSESEASICGVCPPKKQHVF